jgi:hypothetical protein
MSISGGGDFSNVNNNATTENVVDRRSQRDKVHPMRPIDSTRRGMRYVPHAHHAKGKKLFGGLARARPLPVGIVEREMHCSVSSFDRKCTDSGCLAVLTLALLLWAGFAAFIIPRSDWRRIVYGSDSLGRTCGEGEWVDRTHVYFPNVQSDLQVLQAQADAAASEAEAAAAVQLSSGDVDIYSDLTSVCVRECPLSGSVVCLDSFLGGFDDLPNASTVAQCYGGVSAEDPGQSTAGVHRNAFFLANYEMCSSCWAVPLNTTDVFFHCVAQQSSAAATVRRCTFPENPDNTSDPEHLDPDDPLCLVVSGEREKGACC